jgi:hypothetical protein
VPKTISALLLTILFCFPAHAEETTFNRIRVPDAKGREFKGILIFSDDDKAVEVRPRKGNPVSIPYAEIDKFTYEFTKRHRVNDETVITAPIGIGAVAMLTKSRIHWLQISYHENELPKEYVIRMDKKNYIRILDAVKAHTGKDPEILGNANKR